MVSTSSASWNDGATKSAIIDFVARVTEEGGPDYVEPAARVAVFDNDGTLWSREAAADPAGLHHPPARRAGRGRSRRCRTQQPYKAAYENDLHWMGAAMVKHYQGDDSDLKLLMGAVAAGLRDRDRRGYDAQVRPSSTRRSTRPEAALPGLRLRADGRAAAVPGGQRLRHLHRLRR